MMLFSHRKGLKEVKREIQKEMIDTDIRNGIWNALSIFYWNKMRGQWLSDVKDLEIIFNRMWIHYYKQPLDTLEQWGNDLYKDIRQEFFEMEWNEVFDYIEFIAKNDSDKDRSSTFKKFCNQCFEQELSAYRFVGDEIVEITSKEEKISIEEALKVTDKFKPVKVHLETALKLLSDKKNPDYRNSIKESISAVEAICKKITGDKFENHYL